MKASEVVWVYVLAGVLRWCWYVMVQGTTAYVVFWLGHSGWWFALAFLLCACITSSNDKD